MRATQREREIVRATHVYVTTQIDYHAIIYSTVFGILFEHSNQIRANTIEDTHTLWLFVKYTYNSIINRTRLKQKHNQNNS